MILESLTPTELRALELKSQCFSRKQAAIEMGCCPNHVKNLWQSIRRKAKAITGMPVLPTLHATTARVGQLSNLHQI